jgi:DNA-binding CsgD family transcriptional regulator
LTARQPAGPAADRPPTPSSVDLRSAAAALYDDLRLSPILTRLLDQSSRLLGVTAGSISLVDAAHARYAKAAERGAACQLGQTFPLDEGITGRVAEDRRPVVLARYSDVRAGHLPASHPAARGAVAAVPIWWRGEVLGVNVAFAGRDRRFSTEEVDQLEVLSQIGAAGIVSAAAGDPALSVLLPAADHAPGPAPLVVTEVGPAHARDARTSSRARALVAMVEHDVLLRQPGARLRVVLLHQQDRLRVLLHDEGGALSSGSTLASTLVLEGLQRSWSRAVSLHSGTLHVERVPGWGVLVLADLLRAAEASSPASSLSSREQQVLGLLARGLTDRQVAEELVIARKTVEKHVGAVLRKTGTTSRTAAVVRALEDGWLPSLRRAPAG